MTRLHEPTIEALAKKEDEQWILRSPAPGWFIPNLAMPMITRGQAIGELDVLGRRFTILAPDVTGLATSTAEQLTPRAVSYGDVLVIANTAASIGSMAGKTGSVPAEAMATTGLVFRAPTSGRFYSRSTPDKPVFVSVGDELTRGTTVCLLEVMKTFNRVTYGGANLPERARVREVLVVDGADVTAGDPLLALEPA
ncbi:hypothetical protein BH11MYX3_BH11MYX3_25430 [soil metagenome]